LKETRYVLLIGSVADGTADEFSDIDLLVLYEEEPTEVIIAACLGKDAVSKFRHGEFHFDVGHTIDGIPSGVMFTPAERIEEFVGSYPDISHEAYGELSRYIVNGMMLHGDQEEFSSWRAKCERVPETMKRDTIANVMGSLNFYFRGGSLLQLARRGDWIMVSRTLGECVLGILRVIYLLNDRVMVKPKQTRVEMESFSKKPHGISDRLEALYLLKNTVADVGTKVAEVIRIFDELHALIQADPVTIDAWVPRAQREKAIIGS
jgi:predicted nucleotidyltransferase